MPREPLTEDEFVSVVAVLEPSVSEPDRHIEAIAAHVAARYANFEIIAVDNGLDNAGLASIRDVLHRVECVRVVRLSRAVSMNTATLAGLDSAIGDLVITFEPGLDPLTAIDLVLERLRAGSEIVQGVSTVPFRDGPLGDLARSAFYSYNRRSLGIDIPRDATYLTGLTRRAVNALTTGTRQQRFVRHLIRHSGFAIADVPYTPVRRPERRGSVWRGLIDAIEMVSSYSTHPLRIVTVAGLVAALLNLVYIVYVLVVRLVRSGVAEGWTTTSLQMSIMFFVICVILAVQAEYLGRILAESRREIGYLVMEELESDDVVGSAERRNVAR